MKRSISLLFLTLLFGCAAKVRPEIGFQLSRQELEDVIAKVVNQSAQNGLFNFQINQETGSIVLSLFLAAYLIGSLIKGSVRIWNNYRKETKQKKAKTC